ncbi:MAG: DNA polymerase III subunit chi [Gammaproteobacteria bacterium HGW-Gammaproteobacteria-3]|jgi:DNA polymerase-3 subunit chi|nr:MAG: DNA polymerase III subunit chi [Gammaproteobacteria bacterium HGW-Gammaproteobacteria-3]
MPDVSFYLLASQSERERLYLACKLAEKAYRSGRFCYILTAHELQGKTLDDLLWTFRAGSFVPHQFYIDTAAIENKVLIGTAQSAPEPWQAMIINLSANPPEKLDHCERLLEILDNDENIKAQGRLRYKQYQQAGFKIATHKL